MLHLFQILDNEVFCQNFLPLVYFQDMYRIIQNCVVVNLISNEFILPYNFTFMFTCYALYMCKEYNFSGTCKCMGILVKQILFFRHSLQTLKCCLEQPLGYFLHPLQLITCLSANSGLHSVIYFKVSIKNTTICFFCWCIQENTLYMYLPEWPMLLMWVMWPMNLFIRW